MFDGQRQQIIPNVGIKLRNIFRETLTIMD